jgi:hypothetical protein
MFFTSSSDDSDSSSDSEDIHNVPLQMNNV